MKNHECYMKIKDCKGGNCTEKTKEWKGLLNK